MDLLHIVINMVVVFISVLFESHKNTFVVLFLMFHWCVFISTFSGILVLRHYAKLTPEEIKKLGPIVR